MNNRLKKSQQLSSHTIVRMSQRGYLRHDLELIRLFGTPVQDGYLITRKDIMMLSRDLQRLERIEGTFLVEQEGTLVTIYRPNKNKRRKLKSNDSRRPKRRSNRARR